MLSAFVLGLVQGVTEFLPISSSAHLVLVPYFAGWAPMGLAFDVALHFGTLAAVVWHFRADLVKLGRALVTGGGDEARRLLGLLAVASVPVAVSGAALEGSVERVFSEPMWTAGLLLVMAAWLVAGERAASRSAPVAMAVGSDDGYGERDARLASLKWSDAAVVGVAQAAALLPGISRSGSTIATGMLRGVDRQTAARFSFLLSIPAIVGAIVVQAPAVASAQLPVAAITLGVGASFVSGLWAIRWLLRVISTRGLTGFAAYLAVLAAVVLVTGQV